MFVIAIWGIFFGEYVIYNFDGYSYISGRSSKDGATWRIDNYVVEEIEDNNYLAVLRLFSKICYTKDGGMYMAVNDTKLYYLVDLELKKIMFVTNDFAQWEKHLLERRNKFSFNLNYGKFNEAINKLKTEDRNRKKYFTDKFSDSCELFRSDKIHLKTLPDKF